MFFSAAVVQQHKPFERKTIQMLVLDNELVSKVQANNIYICVKLLSWISAPCVPGYCHTTILYGTTLVLFYAQVEDRPKYSTST
jgi:hypothetical protein